MNIVSVLVLPLVFLLSLSSTAVAQSGSDMQTGLDLFDAKKYPEAQEFFQNQSRENPDDAVAAYYLGRSYYQSRQIKEAIASLERAVKLDGKNAENRYLLGMAYASYVFEVGYFKKMSMVKLMKNAWFTATGIDENHKDSQIAIIGFYLNAPGVAGGSLEEGAKRLDLLKRKYPDEIFSMEGLLAEKEERYEDAERIYRQAFDSKPTPRNIFGLASYLNRREQFDEAVKLFKEYLALDPAWNDPSKAHVHFLMGGIFADRKMKAEAKEAFQLAKADNVDKNLKEMIEKRIEELKHM